MNAKDHPLAKALKGLAEGDPKTTEQFLELHEARVENTGLDPKTFDLVRLATLVALEAPPVSWLVNMKVSQKDGVTMDYLEGALKAIAPLVGTAKLATAAGNIARAYGISYDIDRAG